VEDCASDGKRRASGHCASGSRSSSSTVTIPPNEQKKPPRRDGGRHPACGSTRTGRFTGRSSLVINESDGYFDLQTGSAVTVSGRRTVGTRRDSTIGDTGELGSWTRLIATRQNCNRALRNSVYVSLCSGGQNRVESVLRRALSRAQGRRTTISASCAVTRALVVLTRWMVEILRVNRERGFRSGQGSCFGAVTSGNKTPTALIGSGTATMSSNGDDKRLLAGLQAPRCSTHVPHITMPFQFSDLGDGHIALRHSGT